MKLQNIIRTNVVAIGFAAALSLAGGARAQEIDNTVWADSANVEAFPQPARLAVADQLNAKTADAPETGIASAIAQPAVSKEAIISGGTSSEGWLIGSSLLLMSPVAVLLLSKVRRAKHGENVRNHNERSTALY